MKYFCENCGCRCNAEVIEYKKIKVVNGKRIYIPVKAVVCDDCGMEVRDDNITIENIETEKQGIRQSAGYL